MGFTFIDLADDFVLGEDNKIGIVWEDEASPPAHVTGKLRTDLKVAYRKADGTVVAAADPAAGTWDEDTELEIYILTVPAAVCSVEGPLYMTIKCDDVAYRRRRYKVPVKAATISDRVADVDTAVGTAISDIAGVSLQVSTNLTAIQSVQNNTTTNAIVPQVLGIPDSGSTTYRFFLYLYDNSGNPEAPDSAPTVEITNIAGGVITASTPTIQDGVKVGVYYHDFTVANTDTAKKIKVEFTVVEGGVTRYVPRVSEIMNLIDVDEIKSGCGDALAIYGAATTTNVTNAVSTLQGAGGDTLEDIIDEIEALPDAIQPPSANGPIHTASLNKEFALPIHLAESGVPVPSVADTDVLCRIQNPSGVWQTISLGISYYGVDAIWSEEDASNVDGEYSITFNENILDAPGLWRGYVTPDVAGLVPFDKAVFNIQVSPVGSTIVNQEKTDYLVCGLENEVLVSIGPGYDTVPPTLKYIRKGDTTEQVGTLVAGSTWEQIGGSGNTYMLTLGAAICNVVGPFQFSLLDPSSGSELLTVNTKVVRVGFNQMADKNMHFAHVYATTDISERNCLAGKLSYTVITAKNDGDADFSNGVEIARIYYFYDEFTVDGKIIKVGEEFI